MPGYPYGGAEALDDTVHRVEEETDHLLAAACCLSGVSYEFSLCCAEPGVEFVFGYPALWCVPGQGWLSVGVHELDSLFDADDSVGSSGHELVLRGEVVELAPLSVWTLLIEQSPVPSLICHAGTLGDDVIVVD